MPVLFLSLLLLGPAASASSASQASSCFPFEQLSPVLQEKADAMLLRALDGEALYTIAGGLKPMSSGFVSASIKVDAPDLAAAEEARQILALFTCGPDIVAGMHHFANVFQGTRAIEAVVFHRGSLRTLLEKKRAFFAPYGLSPSSDPMEVVMAVEYDPTVARLRGYGYLFGYPDHAVDFFATAAQTQRDEEAKTGKGTLVPRDFFNLPTARGENRFVYAVPKGHDPNAEDQALRVAAEKIYADYAARRARHITGDSPAGVRALVREWLVGR
jgi:hypothetical protein